MHLQTIASSRGNLDLAVSSRNASSEEITLLRIQNVSQWLDDRSDYSIETIGERLGEINDAGKVDGEVTRQASNNQLVRLGLFMNRV